MQLSCMKKVLDRTNMTDRKTNLPTNILRIENSLIEMRFVSSYFINISLYVLSSYNAFVQACI